MGLGIVAAAATLGVYGKVLAAIFAGPAVRMKPVLTSAALVLLILLTNLVGLAYTGMEHSLQVLLVALVVLGLVGEGKTALARGL